MSKFRLIASDKDIDDVCLQLLSKKASLINVFDPVGNHTSIYIRTMKGYKSGYVKLELDLWRAGCDFSVAGQKHFQELGYTCGPRLLSIHTESDQMMPVLDKMLQDLTDTIDESFKILTL